jgi:aromatic ring-opening dioxygenase catalytic subunit (LigB family)
MPSSIIEPARRLPTLYLPHGGGPCFFMDWPGDPHTWDQMGAFLREVGSKFARPKAIVVVSAHWEESEFTVTTNPQPPLLFDYYGFPAHTYELQYPAPGSPLLAQRIQELLDAVGIPVRADAKRGFDHGVFIPLMLVYPEADIPIVQLSLKIGLDAATHMRAGKALSALRDEEVLIIASGMSFHNMQGFFNGGLSHPSLQFDQWLTSTIAQSSTDARDTLLTNWESAPGALESHPRSEHLLPLMVAAGAASDEIGQKIFETRIKDSTISAYSFGGSTSL